jgi:Polymerase beta, Nucleotidyltransferase
MVLLFGSRARGDARPDSDVDLIVVWKDENPPPKRSAAVRLALGHVGFPMDLAVVTPSEFARFREWRGHVFHSAAREGIVLHAARLIGADGRGSLREPNLPEPTTWAFCSRRSKECGRFPMG